MRNPNVAIDGLAASGKTTVAKALALRLGLVFLDTGMMYRAVTWEHLRRPEAELGELARTMDLAVQPDVSSATGCKVLVAGQDVSSMLHSPEVSREVPRVAAVSEVRRALVARQQELARGGGIVMVGRDIATVVLPDAEVKIFLTATPEERARRRYAEMCEKNPEVTEAEVLADLQERDRLDTTREDSPLECVSDAYALDTTGLTEEQVLDRLCERVVAART